MSEKLLSHRAALTNIIKRIAIDAGALVLEYFDGIRDIDPKTKEDGSPVTQADLQAEHVIKERLEELLPDIPVIGEEAYSKGYKPDLSKQDYFWLVDPLDGTRAFLRGEEEFTTNIALIHKGDPVLGVIYAPAKEQIYCGYTQAQTRESKAFRQNDSTEKEKPIHVRKMPNQGLTVTISGHHAMGKELDQFLQKHKIASVIHRASSIKICTIARGKADLYPRFGPTGEWDTAAGHAILRAAGGDICDINGAPLRYGTKTDGNMLNPDFIAASADFFSVYKA